MPLPLRLLISYLLVLGIGTVPTFVYVQIRLTEGLQTLAFDHLSASIQRSAAALAPLTGDALVERARLLAPALRERLTLIAADGAVLIDGDGGSMENHLGRTEVKAALDAKQLLDVAMARRVSRTTGRDTLYAATRLPVSGVVLRLSQPVDPLLAPADDLKVFARNVLAIAISVALGLSLLAAVVFVRPLERVLQTARALATGDLSARSRIVADDEIGDVGRALDQMAVDLRRLLANAGSGDAVLAQLVDALPIPCVVFDAGGQVMALNASARTALHIDGPHVGQRMQHLTSSGRFRRALEEAEADGDPEPIVVDVDDRVRFEGFVHVLKRPGVPPLTVLLGEKSAQRARTELPAIEAVRPRPFGDVLKEAEGSAQLALTEAGLAVEVDDTPGVLVADAGGRLARALGLALEGCASSLQGRAHVLNVDVHVEETRVRLAFDAVPDSALIEVIRPLLLPVGGDVSIDGKEATLWLPRA